MKVTYSELDIYAKYFQEYFARIFKGCNKNIKVVLYPKVKSIYSIFELIISDTEIDIKMEFENNTNKFDKAICDFNKTNKTINFEENSFFIIKTREVENWSLESAKLDLSKIIDEILEGE